MRDFNSGKIVQYMTGQNARAALTDGTVSDVSDFYTDADRFSTPQFRASFYSAMIRALWLYAAEDIKVDGKTVVPKGTLIEKATTGADGKASYKAELPINYS